MGESVFKTSKYYDMIEVKLNDSHPHAYKPHLHSELSIGIIEKGKTILTIDDTDYELSEGDAVIIMPYVIHNCQPVDINNWAFTMIYLDDSYRDALVNSISKEFKIGITKLGKKEFDLIKNLAQTLKGEHEEFIKEVELIDCINIIIESIDVRIAKEVNLTLNKVKEYLEECFLETLSLDELSNKFKINKFRLIRQFKKIFNSTPSAYQLQLKVDYAKGLMKNEDDLVKISLEARFYDQAHFTREFKKSTGLTPNQYVQSQRHAKGIGDLK